MADNSILSMLFLLFISTAYSYKLLVDPAEIKLLPEGSSRDLRVYLTNCTDAKKSLDLKLESGGKVLQHPPYVKNVTCCHNSTEVDCGAKFTVKGTLLGFGELYLVNNETGERTLVNIGVVRPQADIKDPIFLYGLMVGAALTTLGFGVELDLQKVKKYLRKPIGPVLATCCQFILMPTIAFVVTFITNRNSALEFGLFASGVTPGGGASNIWAYLLGGDVDLSVTLTFISMIASIAFLPLWMYTAGDYILKDSPKQVSIPAGQIAMSLALFLIPLAIGILINRFLPRVAKVLGKIHRVFLIIFILFLIVTGIYSNIYAFKMVFDDYQLAVSVLAIPYVGGLCGLLFSFMAKLSRKQAITIGIETATQNTNIATIILRTSLPQPWADISSALPICLTMISPFIFYPLVVIRLIYLKCFKKKNDDETTKAEEVIEAADKKKEGSPTADGSANPAFSPDSSKF